MKKRFNQKGFTLIEIIVVVVILAILASLILPRMLQQTERANIAEAQQYLGAIRRSQIALNDATLVFSQTIGIFPKRDIAVHIDLLRHPVVCATSQILLPSPLVLKWHQLVHIC